MRSYAKPKVDKIRNNTVFICKTDLNTDGRILNQLQILSEELPDERVYFILLPDKPTVITLPRNTILQEIYCTFRHKRLLRALTVIESTLKALYLLIRVRPKILHVQDSSVAIPVLLYITLFKRKTKVIYDDHEIPNENDTFSKRIMNVFENLIVKKADFVLCANEERLTYLKENLDVVKPAAYFLNIPHSDNQSISLDERHETLRGEIKCQTDQGIKFIIHQGPLAEQRGRRLIAELSGLLPSNYKILLIGGTRDDFENFIKEYSLNADKFLFIGKIRYDYLATFWLFGVASIVIYLPKFRNNRLCAPNRFYLSIYKCIPTIVNKDNPVLFNFTENYNCGIFIEDLLAGESLEELIQGVSFKNSDVGNLLSAERAKFIENYKNLL